MEKIGLLARKRLAFIAVYMASVAVLSAVPMAVSTAQNKPSSPENAQERPQIEATKPSEIHTKKLSHNNTKNTLQGKARQKAVTRVEDYLNSLTTFAAQFEQTVSGTQPSSGMFYFKKPGKFLWHYLKPTRAKLVSSGGTIYFHDQTNNQTTQVPRKGLADLLTRDTIELNNNIFTPTNIFTKAGLLYLTLKIDDVAEGDVGGQLKMTFLQNPLQLRQITTINQMNQPVDVLLYNIKENPPIENDIFNFIPFHYREK